MPPGLTDLKRIPERGTTDRSVIDPILDSCLIAHVGFVRDGFPAVVPTLFVRDGDSVLIHGSPASAPLRAARHGQPLCLAITAFDGLVLARSAFHHSANYRSVVVYGQGLWLTGEEHETALDRIIDRLVPDRRPHLRPMTRNEIKGTAVVSIPLDNSSAKTRAGMPVDEAADYELPIWAGVVPVDLGYGPPLSDPRNQPEVEVPDHVKNLVL